ncbi:MAG: DUF1573 domain-containing protein [Bacteroidota bacterium]
MLKIVQPIILALLMFSISLPAFAQNNPRKELNKLMKDMPVELQQQILNYATNKKNQYERVQAKLDKKAETAAAISTQKTAEERPVQLKPKPATAVITPKATTTPATATPPKPPVVNNKPYWEQRAEELAPTNVKWGEEVHEFGTVTSGDKVKHTFTFTNSGDQPLELTRVKASCGCTVPNYSKEPIKPGEQGTIDVTFNSTGKRGRQVKTITVTGNFEGLRKVLRIQGEVKPTE